MIKSQTVVTIEKSFRSLIQSHNYEKYVLTIINKSQEIFKGLVFTGIEDQAHGESDYVDSNGQFYDSKLLFDEEQGRLIGDPKNDLDKWLQAMLDEKLEFGKWIRERTLSFLPETKLYQVMKKRLVTVNGMRMLSSSYRFRLRMNTEIQYFYNMQLITYRLFISNL